MADNFNIKESYEYKRRFTELKIGLMIELIVFCGSIIVVLLSTLSRINDEYFSLPEMISIGLAIVLFFLLLISPLVFIPLYKMLYLTKHYSEFKPCRVKMTNPQPAYLTRRQLYYFNVKIDIDGKEINTSTNAVFPSHDELTGNPFNNKTFECLYDSKKDKLYVMQKID